MKKIEILPYNPAWVEMFEKEANLITTALQDNIMNIYHIGSTSVQGLYAKPIIDIILEVKNPKTTITALENLGYKYKGEYNIPMRLYFAKDKFHLHVYPENHPEIELNIKFRDYLRENSGAREAYSNLKHNLISNEEAHNKQGKFSGYTVGKRELIDDIIRKSGFNRLRMLKCSHPKEFEAAKSFRNTNFFDKAGIKDPYLWTFENDKHTHLMLYLGSDVIGYSHIQHWDNKRAALRIMAIDFMHNPIFAGNSVAGSVLESSCTLLYTPVLRSESPNNSLTKIGSVRSLTNENIRNKGYGSQFLSLIEEWLRFIDIKSLHMESSPRAENFYRKNNYTDAPFDDPDGYESDPQDIPLAKFF
ncbi:MAG: hypothetical protein BGO27_02780 [Alphaproteobacteria bacterium 33-17]|nr:MAG: hypothetical protein BGO27_02780 [Alphaproteobacteria bacterium 33-17]